MEGYCSTGQSPQRAEVPLEEEESEEELTEILKETKSTHSSEYSSGYPDEPGIQ
jgi:hypothetical protein